MAFTFTITPGTVPDQFVGGVQQLFNLFCANITIQASGAFAGITFGGPMPTTDVGLWLPTGSQTFYFYSAAAGKYLPSANVPTGSIVEYPSTTPPDGWLLCDGTVKAQATYPQLYQVIGLNYSLPDTADGPTTTSNDANSLASAAQFRVPDFRGRIPIGTGSGTANTAGGSTILTPRTLGHRLGQEQTKINAGDVPNFEMTVYDYVAGGASQANVQSYGGYSYDPTSARQAPVTNGSTADANTQTNIPPTEVVSFIIRT